MNHVNAYCTCRFLCSSYDLFIQSLSLTNFFFVLKLSLARESECQPCPPGKYCRGAGVVSFPSDISGNCDPGFYCVQGVNTPRPSQNFTGIGGVCPPGAYCPEASPEPIGCPSGTFSNVSQLQSPSNCTLCSDGHYCEQTNLTEPTGEMRVSLLKFVTFS